MKHEEKLYKDLGFTEEEWYQYKEEWEAYYTQFDNEIEHYKDIRGK